MMKTGEAGEQQLALKETAGEAGSLEQTKKGTNQPQSTESMEKPLVVQKIQVTESDSLSLLLLSSVWPPVLLKVPWGTLPRRQKKEKDAEALGQVICSRVGMLSYLRKWRSKSQEGVSPKRERKNHEGVHLISWRSKSQEEMPPGIRREGVKSQEGVL